MKHTHSLNQLSPGQCASIQRILTEGAMRRRLLDLGMIKDTKVVCLGRSPLGDPSAYLVRGAVIAIRDKDSRQILINIKPS